VELQDSGGTANGGLEISAPQTFAISVLGAPQLEGRYNGLARTADGQTPAHGNVGLLTITGSRKGTLTGRLTLGGRVLGFKGSVDPDGVVRFGEAGAETVALKRRGLSTLTLSLSLRGDADSDRFIGTVRDGAVEISTVSAERAVYDARTNPVPPVVLDAAGKGRHTALFLAKAAPNGGLETNVFPQGDGYGLLRITRGGKVKIAGALADGSRFSYANTLSATNRWPFYIGLYKRAGSCTGEVAFRDIAAQSDLDGLDLQWFRPNLSAAPKPPRLYPQGWPAGIRTDLLGSRYVVPPGTTSVLPGVGAPDADGNARFTATGGGLAAEIVQAMNIQPRDRIVIVPPDPAVVHLAIARSSGKVKGNFADLFGEVSGPRKAKLFGAVFQKQQTVSGFFLGPAEAGKIEVAADN